MNHRFIKQIVEEVFNKAKNECPSDAHTTLSKHIEAQSSPRISYKTVARAYKKYINDEAMDWSPNAESIINFCKYLGYKGYKDYLENTPNRNVGKKMTLPFEVTGVNLDKLEPKLKAKKDKLPLALKMINTLCVMVICFLSFHKVRSIYSDIKPKETHKCMAWADTKYEIIDCDLQHHPQYGTKVIPDIPYLRKSMFKLKNVYAGTSFFSEETNTPIVWYYKAKNGTIEYFTAPGKHPVNGKTLKKITEWIIEKYVPIHNTQSDSFTNAKKQTNTK